MTKNFLQPVEILSAQGGETLPEWVHLLPLGKVEVLNQEPFNVDQAALERLVAGFRARGIDLVIDYEHQTLMGVQAPAAGWIKELEARADGLWAKVEWTKQAQAYLKNREYRYFSPVMEMDSKTREPLKLYHVGLTNFPAINNLPALVAKMGMADGAQAAAIIQGLQAGTPAPQEEAMIKRLTEVLALKAETPEAEVFSVLQARLALAGALPEIAQAAGLKPEATVSEIKGTVLALKQGQGELVALTAKVAALETASAQGKAEAAVQEALEARKITPAEKEFALKYALQDLEAFKAWVAAKPEVVPGGPGLKTPKPGATGQEGLDSDQLTMCTNAGIKPEAFKASHQQLVEQGLLKDGR